MNEQERAQRNVERLAEMYPSCALRVRAVLDDLEMQGLRPRIQAAWRSPADQLVAYRGGFSKLRFGFHNVTGVSGLPEALAADVLDDDAPTLPSSAYLLQLAAAAEKHGLRSGIRWGLPPALALAIDTAIRSEDWQASVKVGWDPTHIETTGVTVAQARLGQRPA